MRSTAQGLLLREGGHAGGRGANRHPAAERGLKGGSRGRTRECSAQVRKVGSCS